MSQCASGFTQRDTNRSHAGRRTRIRGQSFAARKRDANRTTRNPHQDENTRRGASLTQGNRQRSNPSPFGFLQRDSFVDKLEQQIKGPGVQETMSVVPIDSNQNQSNAFHLSPTDRRFTRERVLRDARPASEQEICKCHPQKEASGPNSPLPLQKTSAISHSAEKLPSNGVLSARSAHRTPNSVAIDFNLQICKTTPLNLHRVPSKTPPVPHRGITGGDSGEVHTERVKYCVRRCVSKSTPRKED